MHPLGTALPHQQWWHLLARADCGKDTENDRGRKAGTWLLPLALASLSGGNQRPRRRAREHARGVLRLQPISHLQPDEGTSLEVALRSRQVLGWPEPWLVASSKLANGLEMEQSHSLIPDP